MNDGWLIRRRGGQLMFYFRRRGGQLMFGMMIDYSEEEEGSYYLRK